MQNPFVLGEQLLRTARRRGPGVLQADVLILMEASRDSEQLLQNLVREHQQLPSRILSELEKGGVKESQVQLSLRLCFYQDLSMDPEPIRMCSVLESEKLQRYADAVSENTAGMKSALEALYCAFCSLPRPRQSFRQQHILVYAVSPAYPLENPMNRIDPEYPLLLERNVLPYSPPPPKNLAEMKELWQHPGETELDPFHSFLAIHALPGETWMEIGQWNRAEFHPAGDIRALVQAWQGMPGELAERILADLHFRPDNPL